MDVFVFWQTDFSLRIKINECTAWDKWHFWRCEHLCANSLVVISRTLFFSAAKMECIASNVAVAALRYLESVEHLISICSQTPRVDRKWKVLPKMFPSTKAVPTCHLSTSARLRWVAESNLFNPIQKAMKWKKIPHWTKCGFFRSFSIAAECVWSTKISEQVQKYKNSIQ